MKEKITYDWDSKKGIAVCTIINTNGTFTGVAKCHPEDMDMESEKTGLSIAEKRARIKVVKKEKALARFSLGIYNNLYCSMNTSKYFNEKSYETRRLNRFIDFAKDDIETADMTIEVLENDLKSYIDAKANLYETLRGIRSTAKACSKHTDKKEEAK